MILSDSEIFYALSHGGVVIDPPPEAKDVQPTSIELHLSSDFLIYRGDKVLTLENAGEFLVRHTSEVYTLSPGEFILGSTVERVNIPDNLAARVEGKSSIGRLGVAVHVTAGFIDPGFNGNVTLEIVNHNRVPVMLRSGQRIAQICFFSVLGAVIRPYGSACLGSHYQNSSGTVGPKY